MKVHLFTGKNPKYSADRVLRDSSQELLRLREVPTHESLSYKSEFLDCQVLNAGIEIISRASASRVQIDDSLLDAKGIDDIIICTMMSRSGGHSAFIRDLIRHNKEVKFLIILTGRGIAKESEEISLKQHESSSLTLRRIPRYLQTSERVLWVNRLLKELGPKRVWLMSHPHDSISLAAVADIERSRIIYIHHADTHVSLGASIR